MTGARCDGNATGRIAAVLMAGIVTILAIAMCLSLERWLPGEFAWRNDLAARQAAYCTSRRMATHHVPYLGNGALFRNDLSETTCQAPDGTRHPLPDTLLDQDP